MQTAALLFEFVPLDVFFCLSEVEDVKTRLNAISNLYCLTYDYVQEFNKLQNLRNRQLLKQLSENINYFLLFLQQLLEDTNFHIVITTLNIIQMLVEHLPKTVLKQNRETLLSTTLKLLGDQKNVIYQSIVDICLLLVNVLSGRFVISCLAEQTAGKQPNVRQNALCVLKSLLLQIPNLDLDLHELCKKLAPTVFDVIPQVRFSGLECLVVVARCIQQRRQNKVEEENYSSFFEAFLQGVPVSVEQADKTAAILCLQQRLAWYDLPCPVLQGSILMPGQVPMSTQRDSFYRTDNESRASLQRGFVMEDLADHSVLEASYTNFPFGTSLATSSWNSRDGFLYTPADRVCGIRDPWGDECQFSEVSFARTALPGTKKPMRPNCRARIPWRGPHVPAPLPNRSSYLEQFAVQKQSQERTGCGDAEKNNKRCISFDLNTMVAPSTTRTDCRSPFLLVCGEEGHPGGGSGGFTLRPCRPPRIRCHSKHTGPGTGVQASMRKGDIVGSDCRAAASMDCETEPQKEVERELASPKNVPVVRRKVRNAPLKRWSSVDDTEFKQSLAPQFLATCRMPTGKEKEEVRKEVDDVETSDEEPSANGSFNMNRGVRESVCLQGHAYEEPEVTPEELAHSVRTIRTSASQKRLNSILESGSALGRYDKNSSVSFSNLTASRIGLWAERFGSVDDTAFDKANNDERRKKETLQSSGYSSATSKTNCEQQRPEKCSHESTSRSVREVKLSESPTKVHSFSPKNSVDLKPPKPIKSKRRMIPRSKTSEISSNLDFMRINVDCDASDPPQVLLKLNSPLWDEQHRAIVCLLQATETLDKDDEVTSEGLPNWTEVQIHSLLQSLTVAVTNLRSQVSRAAIHLIRNLSHKLGNKRLEAEAFHLIPSLLSRIGGDSSTAFIRAEAHDCLFVLIGKINPLCAVGCLNTAVNSGHGRSSVGRSAIAAALAAVLPGLVGLEGWQQAKAGRFEAIRTTMDLRGKRKECFDRLVKNVATFLADGNQETRQCGRSMLRALIHVAGFENYCFHILSERSWLTVRDSLEKMGLRTNPRSTSKARKLDPLRTRSVLKRSASCPRTDPTSLAPVLSKAAPKGNPVARKDDPGRRLRILIADLAATDPQETLKSLRQLGRKVAANKLDVCSPDLKQLTFGICRLLNHSTEEVVLHAANFCIDARRLLGVPAPSLKSVPTSNFPAFANDLTSGGGEPGKDLQKAELTEEKFPPGLLALLFLHEDAEGFTGVLDIFANQLACSNPDVAYLAREACEKTRKILGPEALVKPLLHGQRFQEDPDKRAILIEELSDVTADLDTSCVLLDQYLVPEVLQLTSVATQFPDSQRLQSAVQSFVRCVYNQAGDTLLQAAKSADASEPLETTLECS